MHDDSVNEKPTDKRTARTPGLRRRDRRPKAAEPMTRLSVSIERDTAQLARSEMIRRGFPSVSAYVDSAIKQDAMPKGDPEELDVAGVLRDIQARLHQMERGSAERDVVAIELMAGLARAFFVTTPQPKPEDRAAMIADAGARTERFLNAIGRRLESGETTLDQLPHVNFDGPMSVQDGNEKNLPAGDGA